MTLRTTTTALRPAGAAGATPPAETTAAETAVSESMTLAAGRLDAVDMFLAQTAASYADYAAGGYEEDQKSRGEAAALRIFDNLNNLAEIRKNPQERLKRLKEILDNAREIETYFNDNYGDLYQGVKEVSKIRERIKQLREDAVTVTVSVGEEVARRVPFSEKILGEKKTELNEAIGRLDRLQEKYAPSYDTFTRQVGPLIHAGRDLWEFRHLTDAILPGTYGQRNPYKDKELKLTPEERKVIAEIEAILQRVEPRYNELVQLAEQNLEVRKYVKRED